MRPKSLISSILIDFRKISLKLEPGSLRDLFVLNTRFHLLNLCILFRTKFSPCEVPHKDSESFSIPTVYKRDPCVKVS